MLKRKSHSREREPETYLPYIGHATPGVVLLDDGSLMAMLKLDGVGWETGDADEVNGRHAQRNILLRNIASERMVYRHARRAHARRRDAISNCALPQRLRDRTRRGLPRPPDGAPALSQRAVPVGGAAHRQRRKQHRRAVRARQGQDQPCRVGVRDRGPRQHGLDAAA